MPPATQEGLVVVEVVVVVVGLLHLFGAISEQRKKQPGTIGYPKGNLEQV